MNARVRKIRSLSAIVVSVTLGLVLVAFGAPDSLPYPLDGIFFVSMHGTVIGQVSLAAVWCALGPFFFARRLALASVWLTAIVLAFGCNRAIASKFDDLDLVLTSGIMVLSQWTFVFVPMWLVADWYGVRLADDGGHDLSGAYQNRQIGIREAMIVTAAVAVVLGAASFNMGDQHAVSLNWEAVRMFGFLVGWSAVLPFPLTLATLVARRRARSVAGAMLCVAIVSALEVSALPLIWPYPRIDVRMCWLVSVFNFIQGTWIVGGLSLMRLGGFVLLQPRFKAC